MLNLLLLTLNGKALPKPYVKRFVARVMGTKQRVHVLAPVVDPFFKAIMVFTSAWVEAKFGTTGWADCIPDDRLLKHIVDRKPSRSLSPEEVAVIAPAFASLARMDQDFRAKTEAASNSKNTDASVSLSAKPVTA